MEVYNANKTAQTVFNPTKNFSALNSEIAKHETYTPMIPQWFGHLETARIISNQKEASR